MTSRREPELGRHDHGSSRTERREAPVGVVLDSLADPDRRLAIQYLRYNGGTASLEELADVLATGGEPTADDRTFARVRARCHHVHLPKLASAGLVEYDTATGTISLTIAEEDDSALSETVEDVLDVVFE